MTTKGWVVAGLLILGFVLFILIGFDITTYKTWNLVSLGLASCTLAALVHIFMGGPELKG